MANLHSLLCTILFLLLLKVIDSQLSNTDLYDVIPDSSCSNSSECKAMHFSSSCVMPAGTDATGQCVCNNTQKFFVHNGSCVYHSDIMQACDGSSSICTEPNSVCMAQNGNVIKRCLCTNETVLIKHNDSYMCVYKLTSSDDVNCLECEMNYGMCFNILGETRSRDGCSCPSVYSGDNCTNNHVNVTCSTQEMTVCYKPHPELVSSDSYFWVHVDGRGNRMSCRAFKMDATSSCPEGTYALVLPLHKALVDDCSTDIIVTEEIIKYRNTIRVQMDPDFATVKDIVFSTFCSFVRVHQLSFFGMQVDVYTDSEVGQEIEPILGLSIKNSFGQFVPENAVYRVGDIVYFNLYLDTRNGYSSMNIDACTLSSSAILGDRNAEVIPIITQGCPALNQYILTSQNTFRKVRNQSNEWQTGMVKLVKLRHASSLHIHCRMKLCIKPYRDGCEEVSCDSKKKRSLSSAVARNKREIETSSDITFVNLHGVLCFEDDNNEAVIYGMSMSAIAFSIVIFIFVIAIVSLTVTSKSRRQKLAHLHTLQMRPYPATVQKNVAFVTEGQLFIKKLVISDFKSNMTITHV